MRAALPNPESTILLLGHVAIGIKSYCQSSPLRQAFAICSDNYLAN